jgi:hypothetical protein
LLLSACHIVSGLDELETGEESASSAAAAGGGGSSMMSSSVASSGTAGACSGPSEVLVLVSADAQVTSVMPDSMLGALETIVVSEGDDKTVHLLATPAPFPMLEGTLAFAEFCLTHASPAAARGSGIVTVYAIEVPWFEPQVSWIQASAGQLWVNPGGDIFAVPISEMPLSGRVLAGTISCWDITSYVNGVYAATMDNNGILLKVTSGDVTAIFHARESTAVDNRPVLRLHVCPL